MADRTIENCTMIKKGLKLGLGEPETCNGKCLGYGKDGDEPCDTCKECKLNTTYEE